MGCDREIGDLLGRITEQRCTGYKEGFRPALFDTGKRRFEFVGRSDVDGREVNPSSRAAWSSAAHSNPAAIRSATSRRTATRSRSGTISLRICSLFPFVSNAASAAMPVMSPPGCARFSTSPSSTGKPIDTNTVGTPPANFFAGIPAFPHTTNRSTCGTKAMIGSSMCPPAHPQTDATERYSGPARNRGQRGSGPALAQSVRPARVERLTHRLFARPCLAAERWRRKATPAQHHKSRQ